MAKEKRPCSVEGCESDAFCKGMCRLHYWRETKKVKKPRKSADVNPVPVGKVRKAAKRNGGLVIEIDLEKHPEIIAEIEERLKDRIRNAIGELFKGK